MNIDQLNTHFSIMDQVGIHLSEEEFAVLMSPGGFNGYKLYGTEAWFTEMEARKAIPRPAETRFDEYACYAGEIIARSFEEATQIAQKRPFGEQVIDKTICDVVPYDEAGNLRKVFLS